MEKLNSDLEHALYEKLRDLNVRIGLRKSTMHMLKYSTDANKAMSELYFHLKNRYIIDEEKLCDIVIKIGEKYKTPKIVKMKRSDIENEWYD